ncbi:MAG: hypothetical protein AB7K09_12465 [Planctomycetota bacterium]
MGMARWNDDKRVGRGELDSEVELVDNSTTYGLSDLYASSSTSDASGSKIFRFKVDVANHPTFGCWEEISEWCPPKTLNLLEELYETTEQLSALTADYTKDTASEKLNRLINIEEMLEANAQLARARAGIWAAVYDNAPALDADSPSWFTLKEDGEKASNYGNNAAYLAHQLARAAAYGLAARQLDNTASVEQLSNGAIRMQWDTQSADALVWTVEPTGRQWPFVLVHAFCRRGTGIESTRSGRTFFHAKQAVNHLLQFLQQCH